MARDYAGIRKDEKLLKAAALERGLNPKSEMYKLPPKFVGGYAEMDAVATLALWRVLKVHLDNEELWDVWNLEIGLIPCMLDMRTKGVRVDLEKADRNKKALREQSKHLRGLLGERSWHGGGHLGVRIYSRRCSTSWAWSTRGPTRGHRRSPSRFSMTRQRRLLKILVKLREFRQG